MTTIATDGKTMAGDGREASDGGHHWSDHACKVFVDPHTGSAFGSGGATWATQMFQRWVSAGRLPADRPDVKDSGLCVLELRFDGALFYWTEKLEPIRVWPPQAIGSGDDYAHGAMMAGKSPVEAVEIASKVDLFTGGTITEITPSDLMKQAAE